MIYVASSWRNTKQPSIINELRKAGHSVYDFRNPAPGNTGFAWSEMDENWQLWSLEEFRDYLGHQIACDGFNVDMQAMERCDTFLLVLPCGRSAHLELGWAVGMNKRTCILLAEDCEPELMYKMVDKLAISTQEVLEWV